MKSKQHKPGDAALDVLRKLRANGYDALFAGGCVRDRLLNQTPKDYDVATSARPEQVTEIFPKARHVGAKFGVVLVRRYGYDIEVATFRTDGEYADGRHPDDVTFASAEKDARRRDFTINGLFFDPIERRIIDYVDGQRDIETRILRTIGAPGQRFEEDHLRMLRAVRFAARLGFSVHANTMTAIRQHAAKLARISPERVWMELAKILAAPTRSVGWELILEAGLRPHLCSKWPDDELQDHMTAKRLAALPDRTIDPSLALAACAPGSPQAVCQGLRLSNRQTDTVVWLLSALPRAAAQESLELADVKQLMGGDAWDDLVLLLEADLRARDESLDSVEALRRRAKSVAPENVAPPPLLTGNDLLAMGVEPGPEFGHIIDAAYRAQRNEDIATKEDALDLARRMRR
ncbi:MAG: CCA tRNA nucleotidyltransferase [Planctomycetes bacterium]|nr:CCA tRNA nucleotidyltransferase [Planctomycetota bacterium]